MENAQKVLKIAQELPFSNVGVIDVADIIFHPDLRKSCEVNACGSFGRNWKCPPHCGEIQDCIDQASKYTKAVVVQYIGELEDSYDFEGMMDAMEVFGKLFHQLADQLPSLQLDAYPLGAGGCHLCERCAILDDAPCRQPDRAVASLESHGILVTQLAEKSGMKYINGENTVTYFGAFLV